MGGGRENLNHAHFCADKLHSELHLWDPPPGPLDPPLSSTLNARAQRKLETAKLVLISWTPED